MKSIKRSILLFVLFFGLFVSVFAISTTPVQAESNVVNSTEVIVSYEDVFQSYYDTVILEAKLAFKDTNLSFEEFCDKYYYFDMDIKTYTEAVIDAYVYGEYSDIPIAKSSSSSSSETADYILDNGIFEREPIYNYFDYSVIEIGDIIYETDTIFFDSGHIAMITDYAYDSTYGSYYRTVEAVEPTVSNGFLDDTRMIDYRVKILRVVGASTAQINVVRYFMNYQIGKSYSLNPIRLNTNINSSEWYCSELVYAAYKYANIDIGVKKNSSGNDVYLVLGCLPVDIYNSYNTSEVTIPSFFLEMENMGKSGSYWLIKITNLSSSYISFQYNSKMCFANDAENWSGLNDLVTRSLYPNTSVTVSIRENWFATTVVAGWLDSEDMRFITYGNQLTTSGGIVVTNVKKDES